MSDDEFVGPSNPGVAEEDEDGEQESDEENVGDENDEESDEEKDSTAQKTGTQKVAVLDSSRDVHRHTDVTFKFTASLEDLNENPELATIQMTPETKIQFMKKEGFAVNTISLIRGRSDFPVSLNMRLQNVNDKSGKNALTNGGGVGGSGFQDGTKVATFQIRAGDGGSLDGIMGLDGVASVLDGSDDGTFELVWAEPGVFFDASGTDLSTTTLRAISDANFDMDSDNNKVIDSGPTTNWPHSLQGAGSIMEHFAKQDGSVRFGVEEENGGGEGFTPGFWKNHTEDWMGYDPTDSYADVFGVTVHAKVLKLGDKNDDGELSLLETLNLRGNSIKSFYRHSVAALLNAAHPNVDYAFTETEVKDMVQEAFATGAFETFKLRFEVQNELEGDINS